METIRGRVSRDMDGFELQNLLAGFETIALDLGTGDACFVCKMAEQNKNRFFIGIDACRENLRVSSRTKLPNALFVIASAQSLPCELNGLASHVSINFPWGSLLESLLNNDARLMDGLFAVTRAEASMGVLLNGEALSTLGWGLDSGTYEIERALNAVDWRTTSRACLDSTMLRDVPTTWAKRLVVGRDPRAVQLKFRRE